MTTQYTGYWLYNEELEKWHPKDGRLNRIRNTTVISDEELLNVIRRAARVQDQREEVRTTQTNPVSSSDGTDNDIPVEHPEE